MSEPPWFLLGESDATLGPKTQEMPPAAPSRGAVGDTQDEEQIYVAIKPYLQLSDQRGKAKLCLDNDTVFRDMPPIFRTLAF